MSTLDEHKNNIIQYINENDFNRLKNYIQIKNINLKEINIKEFDLLIFAIERNASLPIINYIIHQCQYKTLNYVFNANNGYRKYNNDFLIQNNYIIGMKIPLFSAIFTENFELSDYLLKNNADINYGIFFEGYGNVDLISYFFYSLQANFLSSFNSKTIKYILNKGFNLKNITADLTNKLLFLIERNENDYVKIIFNHFVFDNTFIIHLLNFSKNKISMSQQQLQNLITKEKSKLEINEKLYHCAINENNYDIISLFLEYDGRKQSQIINTIIKYKILDKAIQAYNITLVEKIFNHFNQQQFLKETIETIENLIVEQYKYSNINNIKLILEEIEPCFLENLDMQKILFKINNNSDNNCYNKPSMKNFIKLLIKPPNRKYDTHIDIHLFKNFNSHYLNFILNVLLEINDQNMIKYILENETLKSKININDKDILGNYPIVVAVQSNHPKSFFLLKKFGANDNVRDKNNKTLFSVAIVNQNYEIIKFLIKQKRENNKNNKIYNYNINDIIQSDISDMRENTLENKGIKEEYEFTPLICSYLYGDLTYFNSLLDSSDIHELDSYSNNILYYAILNEDIDLIKYLITKDSNINTYYSALEISLIIQNKDIFNLLLNNNALSLNKPNKFGHVPLITMIKMKNYSQSDKISVIKELIKHGADVNYNNNDYSPLIFAIQENLVDLVNLLIKHGANVNFVGPLKNTPIIYAIIENNLSIVKILIEYGANINHVNVEFDSPIHFAIQHNSVDIADYLIENGAKFILNPLKEYHLFFDAFKFNSLPMIQLLINNGLSMFNQIKYVSINNHSIFIKLFNEGNY